jgi:tetratricopeptide (TPR) repeat protein
MLATFFQRFRKRQVPAGTVRPLDSPESRAWFQLPPRADHFTGRESEIRAIVNDLRPGRVVALLGPGGIGKTALATEAIWRIATGEDSRGYVPEGIIWHSFYNQPKAEQAAQHIATSLGIELDGDPFGAAKLALAGKRVLLFLDGTEAADDLQAILDIGQHCGVLLTSRRRDDAPYSPQDILPLDMTDSLALFNKWTAPYSVNTAVAIEICELLDGLPLAIRLAGRYLASHADDATAYIDWLRDTPLAALNQGLRRLESVPLLLAKSVSQVTDGAQQVLVIVGLLAQTPFDSLVVAAALDEPERNVSLWLDELTRYGLLLHRSPRYAISHALIHEHCRAYASVTVGAAAIMAGMTRHFVGLSQTQSQMGAEGHRQLDEDRLHMIGLLDHLAHNSQWRDALELAWLIEGHLEIHGHWSERTRVIQIGCKAAQELKYRADQGRLLGILGDSYSAQSQTTEAMAYYDQALAIARELDDRQSEGNHLANLGQLYNAIGETQRAMEYYQAALTIAQAIGDERGIGNRLSYLGQALSYLGRLEEAIQHYEQANKIARKLGDRRSESAFLGNLGLAYAALGKIQQAIKYHNSALTIAQALGDRRNEHIHLGNLANNYFASGKISQARKYNEQALAISQEIHDRRNEGVHLSNLGKIYQQLHEVDLSIECFEKALTIARETRDRRSEGMNLRKLGIAYMGRSQPIQATNYLSDALVIARETSDRRSEAVNLANLALAHYALNDYHRAIGYMKAAARLFQSLHAPQTTLAQQLLASIENNRPIRGKSWFS